MEDPNGNHANHHHERAMRQLTLKQTTLDPGYDVEDQGGLHSAWSPDREGETQKHIGFAAASQRISKTVTTAFHNHWSWERFHGKRGTSVGWMESGKAIAMSSWLNLLLILLPVAWASHFVHAIPHRAVFALCFTTLIPLCKLLEYGGENLAHYCGKDIGDLIVVTMNNAVEAILALCLLGRCELRLLQSTIIGVVLLRLLLIPGTAYIVGGARLATQELHPHLTELNQSLLTTGALTLLLPVTFFAALDRGVPVGGSVEPNAVVTDDMRGDLLKVSRGLSIILLGVYVCSRFYIHNPPGADGALHHHQDAPSGFKEMAEKISEEKPEVNAWACVVLLVVATAFMSVTAEFLVDSIEPMRESGAIQEEWFGLILLPIVSFSADAIISIVYFVRSVIFKQHLQAPHSVAEYRSHEISIQFLLLWMPLFVILSWFAHRPMSLLFDLFEVSLLIGACFLVNYVTADAKTNWAEGSMLVALYLMIALTAWFYPGQQELQAMSSCSGVGHYLTTEFPATSSHNDTALRQSNSTSLLHRNTSSEGGNSRPTVIIADLSSLNRNLTEKLQALVILYDVLVAEKVLEDNR